jgi:hypothetical protein
VPAVVNLKRKVPPTATVPLSNVFPSSLVSVWGADDTFFHITVVPGLTAKVAGLKLKLPSLLVMIITVCMEPKAGVGFGIWVGVGVGGIEVGLLVLAVGVLAIVVGAVVEAALVVLPFPHAASSSSAPSIINDK